MNTYNLIDQLVDEITAAIQAEPPSLEELERFLTEAKDMMEGPIYKQETIELQNVLRDAKRDLEKKISELKTPPHLEGEKFIDEQGIPQDSFGKDNSPTPVHNSEAEALMNKGESAFYAGKYQEATGYYENVLKLEPKWDRAIKHKDEAQEYLRSGHIPSDLLPQEVAILFGKAQSAIKILNLKRARDMLEEAKEILKAQEIHRWKDGLKFEEELNNIEDAEEAYGRGLEEFSNGNIEEAINIIQSAADLSGLPKYKDRANEYREVNEQISQIRQKIFARPLTPELVLQASAELSKLQAKYGANSLLQRMHTQQTVAMNQVTGQLYDQVRKSIKEAENTDSISDRQRTLEDSGEFLKTLRDVGIDDDIIKKLSREEGRIVDLKGKVERSANTLNQAQNASSSRKYWNAWKLLREVRNDFPRDSEVEKLGQKLSWIDKLRTGGFVLLGIFTLLIFVMVIKMGLNGWRIYTISLTPSPTPTATFTPTSTPTLIPTATITNTPPPPPTPITLRTNRKVKARNGCYEETLVVGEIPEGASVRLLPIERRFDYVNRECVLVELSGDVPVTGWVLLADLIP
jgi:tetratricopeptide (TPR) repeat protein